MKDKLRINRSPYGSSQREERDSLEENSVIEQVLRTQEACEEMNRRRKRKSYANRYGVANPTHYTEAGEESEVEEVDLPNLSPVFEVEIDEDRLNEVSSEDLSDFEMTEEEELIYRQELEQMRAALRRKIRVIDTFEDDVQESIRMTGIADHFIL